MPSNHEIMRKVAKFRKQLVVINQINVALKRKHANHHKRKISALNKQIVSLKKTIDTLLKKIVKPGPNFVTPGHKSPDVDKLPIVNVVKAPNAEMPNINKHNINAISIGNVCLQIS